MQERSQIFDEDDESETTLVTPRFDADETRRAHPVVPLEAVRAKTDDALSRKTFRVGARRFWPLSLVVVILLAVAAVGGIATKVLRRARAPQAAPAPAVTVQPVQQNDPAQSSSVAPPASDDGGENHPTSRARGARARRSEHHVEIFPPPGVSKDEGDDSVDKDDEHRARDNEKRRKQEGDDEKDSRKVLKRSKKAARLVDVLKGP